MQKMYSATSREKIRWAIQEFLTSNSKSDTHASILVIEIEKKILLFLFLKDF